MESRCFVRRDATHDDDDDGRKGGGVVLEGFVLIDFVSEISI